MARFLALDWDHQQLHVVAANASGKGDIRIQHAEIWKEDRVPNLAEAEALGQVLRERLRAAGIAPAPVLACVGRDRVILKEVRYPAVPAHEEPAIVRFQVVKELTDAPEEVVIDFVSTGPASGGERRAVVLIVRKELLGAYQALCKAAGLKFAGLTPRAFGIVRCLRQRLGSSMLTPVPEPADAAVAVLAVGEHWAEFCVSRGDRVPFYRSLTVGPTLAAEVRRNLAVYAGQAPQQPIGAIYVAGGAEHAPFREKLQDATGLPVHAFDPVAGAAKVVATEGGRGSFAAAVGLVLAQADRTGLPINFVVPRQPKPPADPNRQKLLVGAAVAALVLVLLGLWGYADMWRLNNQLAMERRRSTTLDSDSHALDADERNYAATQEWTNGSVVWLEELHDSTALLPDYENVRVSLWEGDPQTVVGKDKDFVGKVTLTGRTTPEKKGEVVKLHEEVFHQPFYRAEPLVTATPRGGPGSRGRLDFTLKMDAKKRPPDKYDLKLKVPEIKKQAPPDFGGFGGGDFGGPGGGF